MSRLLLALLLVSCEAPDPSGRESSRGLEPPAGSAAPLSIEAQAREYAVASRPGTAHQALEPLVGDWDVALSAIASDGTESDPYRGRATLAWTLGRRFLRWDASVSFGETLGTTTGFVGFNTRTREYQLMMVSDLATGMEIARGTGEIRGSGIVFEIEQVDPASGNRLIARSRLRTVSPDHFVLEQLEPTGSGRDRVTRLWNYRRAAPTR
ncbi:MAG: DUF1579 family protein [Planctomycetota bacterium]